jgi:U3 small nucleolar ribonucleoprotein protein LCP5
MTTTEDLPSELNALLETISTSLSSTSSVLPPIIPHTPNGLSLLDLKNNLLLSYIQNLSLLILSKLNSPTFTLQNPESQATIWNLISDRIHLEKGVAPLETKIGYQIRKLIRAAEDTTTHTTTKDDNLKFKPNPSALVSTAATATAEEAGVYKPPRISSTKIPTTRTEDGPRRNRVLEEFISSSDLNNAPTAVPSIGTNVSGIGARNTYKTVRNADVERYEEENFIRLPANIGKEKTKGKKVRGGMEGFGGEDWSGLDRIGKGGWEFGKKEGKVERSRKRTFDEGGGEDVTGREFEKRKKVLQDRKFRKGQKGGKR